MIFSILTILVCILLVLVILVQNSKGGGIQSQFGAATQIMGVKRGTEFIEKATWALSITLIALCVLMAPKTGGLNSDAETGSLAKKKAQTAVPVPQQQNQQPISTQPAPPEQPK
jgi:preprotein translocase subunit SecG